MHVSSHDRQPAMAPRLFIVTGANKGIGFETAKIMCKALKDEDAVVLITSRSLERGKAAAAKLAEEGLAVEVAELDITDRQSRVAFSASIRAKYGQVDCLVNNAGFRHVEIMKEPRVIPRDDTVKVNYYGTRDVSLVISPMLKPDSKIINVASSCGQNGISQMSTKNRDKLLRRGATVQDIDEVVIEYMGKNEAGYLMGWPTSTYAFSKAAQIALTTAWARLADGCSIVQKDMVITCCCPGYCKTDMSGWEIPPASAEEGAQLVARLALGATKEHHGKFVTSKEIIDPGVP